MAISVPITITQNKINAGAKGDGMKWQGAWTAATAYAVDPSTDVVEDGGTSYVCKLAHTASAADRPGTGANWTTYWELVAKGAPTKNWVDVKDHGATGDGVTDDTAAIEAAIAAFETDATKDVLFFSPGTYFLDTLTADAQTANAAFRYLHLGLNDLTGRDITIKAHPGTTILSNAQSPNNGHMFMVHPSFRSMTVEGVRFKKVDAMQKGSAGAEPNHSTAFAVLPQGTNKVERISFENCTFENCHGAFAIYSANGNLTRGKLRDLVFHKCSFENRHGSNVDIGAAALGGGQQVRASHWAHRVQMTECYGIGGDSPLDVAGISPGGVFIDAMFFGGAENIQISDCYAENYGVEWMFAEATGPRTGFVESSFVMPAPDGIETVNVVMRADELSDYTSQIGKRVSLYKVESVAGETGDASEFEITAWDAGTRTLTLVNPVDRIGFGQADEDATLGALRALYEYSYEMGEFIFTNNVLRRSPVTGEKNTSGTPTTAGQGFASPARCRLIGNSTIGITVGVEIYDNVHLPNINRTRGTLIQDHTHVGRDVMDAAVGPPSGASTGIRVASPDVKIVDCAIRMASAKRAYGINLKAGAEGARVVRPDIWTVDQAWGVNTNATERSVGIGMVTGMTDVIVYDPRVSGFNRGIGSTAVSGLVNFEVRGRMVGSANEKNIDLMNLGFAYANVPHIGHAYAGNGLAIAPVEGAGTTRVKIKTANQGVTGTTYIDDTDLQLPVEANTNYMFEAHIILRGDATNGFHVLLDVPVSSALDGSHSIYENDGTPVTGLQHKRMSAAVVMFRDTFGAAQDTVLRIAGAFRVAGTAGNLKVTFRKRFNNTGGDTQTRTGSYIKLHRLPAPYA